MPKGRGKRSGMDRVVEVPFRTGQTLTVTTSTPNFQELDLTIANLGARAVAIATTYEYFRFKKLHAYQFTSFGTGMTGSSGTAADRATGLHGLSWVDSNAAQTGTATNFNEMLQYEKFRAGNLRSKLSLTMSKGELSALPYKWYHTKSTGASSDALSPGLFVQYIQAAVGSLTALDLGATLIVEGVLEFRGMITPALQFGGGSNVPADKKDESDDDDEEILDILEEVEVDPFLAVKDPKYEDNRRWKAAYEIYMKRRGTKLRKAMCEDSHVGVSAGGGAQGAPASSANPTASKK